MNNKDIGVAAGCILTGVAMHAVSRVCPKCKTFAGLFVNTCPSCGTALKLINVISSVQALLR